MKATVAPLDKTLALSRPVLRAYKESIYSKALIEARSGALRISMSLRGSIMALTCDVTAEVEDEGQVVVDLLQLSKALKTLGKGKITISCHPNEDVQVTSNNATIRLDNFGQDYHYDFSVIGLEDIRFVEVEQTILATLLARTAFSACTDDKRTNLKGVLVENSNGKIRFVAADNYRLALAEQEVAGIETLALPDPTAIPSDSIDIASQFLKNGRGPCQMGAWNGRFALRTSDKLLVLRMPDEFTLGEVYRHVIPTNSQIKTRTIVPRLATLAALKRLAELSDHGLIELRTSTDEVKVSVVSEKNSGSETIPAESTGEDMAIFFTAKYLVDVLNVIPTDDAVFYFTTDVDACVIKPSDEQGFLALVMPCRPKNAR